MSTPATTQAYPLQWPDRWQRSERYRSARYQTEFGKARDDLIDELRRFNATHVVISSNVPTRNDGLPYASAGARRYQDPGVAVYFTIKGNQQVIACDHWDHVKDNIRACGLTVAAMRMIERAGATEIIERAFSGFKALPPAGRPWHKVLRIDPESATLATINAAYKVLAREAHPDAGGTTEAFVELNDALTAGREAMHISGI